MIALILAFAVGQTWTGPVRITIDQCPAAGALDASPSGPSGSPAVPAASAAPAGGTVTPPGTGPVPSSPSGAVVPGGPVATGVPAASSSPMASAIGIGDGQAVPVPWGGTSDPLDRPPPDALADCAAAPPGRAYDVGPGRALADLEAVPWETLGPGDAVRVFWRAQPYRSKVLLSNRGIPEAPIRLCGASRGPAGERPALIGADALTSSHQRWQAWRPLEDLGLIMVANDLTDRYGDRPGYLIIEGLDLSGAELGARYTASTGEMRSFSDGAACINVNHGDHVTVRDTVLHGCGLGLFVLSKDEVEGTLSRDILVEGNRIYGNGVAGQDRKHNVYIQALGVIVQYNDFGRLRTGALGANLKDRSASTVIRHNTIVGSARPLDLVDCQEHARACLADARYRETIVTDNDITVDRDDGSHVIHYGGDTEGFEQNFRKGTLHLEYNRITIHHDEAEAYYTTLIDASTNDETIIMIGNTVLMSGSSRLGLLRYAGHVELDSSNVLPVGWAPGRPSGFVGTVVME